MSTRESEEYSTRTLFYSIQIRTDTLALGEPFSGDLFFVGEESLRTTHVHENVSAFNTLHRTGNDLSLSFSEFCYYRSLLRLTDLLHDNLLGRLRGDASIVPLALNRE